jgi:hypothetical protein
VLVLLSLYPLGLIAVSTTHVLDAMTKVLSSGSDSGACGQIGFPLPLEQGTGGPVLILLGHSFLVLPSYITCGLWLCDLELLLWLDLPLIYNCP